MVLECAMLQVRAGQETAFEEALLEASAIVRTMPGYQSHTLHRCLEAPTKSLLLVHWDRLEDHTMGFRGSAQYQDW